MNENVRKLFRQLADLTPSQREEYYAQRQVPDHLREELESLLRFDAPPGDSLGGVVESAAEQFLRSHTESPRLPQTGPKPGEDGNGRLE